LGIVETRELRRRHGPGWAAKGENETVRDTHRESFQIVAGEALVLGRQVLRSGTGVGANYRALCRARSRPEFIAKLGVVLEEADETVFWLELLIETGMVQRSRLEPLRKEANELTSIFVVSRHTARSR